MSVGASTAFLNRLDLTRQDASSRLRPERRAELGQFLTPMPVARFMASMVNARPDHVRILDAGAGIGSLTAALVSELCDGTPRPTTITATTYEVDDGLLPHLRDTLEECAAVCGRAEVGFSHEIVNADFVESAVEMLRGDLFAPVRQQFDAAILNPPYRKLHGAARQRLLLESVGIRASNLYAAFVVLATRLLAEGGELVAITPRSFCNGPYFRPFREELLQEMEVRRLHVFTSRRSAFRDDDVLQENVIVHAVKGRGPRGRVVLSESAGVDSASVTTRTVAYEEVVRPADPQRFIHLTFDTQAREAADRVASLPTTLSDLGLRVSTGRVVDFRVKGALRTTPAPGTVPLIYPVHLSAGSVEWPKTSRKPNAIAVTPETQGLLLPEGNYVVVKRFSSKEQKRRVSAAVYDPARVSPGAVAFENHLNVFHLDGHGLPPELARGLAAWLNSTVVDVYFRRFSGHTQVNATDLRSLRYPTWSALEQLGKPTAGGFPPPGELDRMVSTLM